MLTICWAAKGGSGTTVVASALAMLVAERHESALLIDLAGDVPAALGIPEPSQPGIHDWIHSSSAPDTALSAITIATAAGLGVIPCGSKVATADHPRWHDLGQFLASGDRRVVIDAGTGEPPAGLLASAEHRLLVTRPCYLALRRATSRTIAATGAIIVHEPGRALRAEDVAAALHLPVVAEVSVDPAVCRAVDAGLMLSRLPRSLSAALRQLA